VACTPAPTMASTEHGWQASRAADAARLVDPGHPAVATPRVHGIQRQYIGDPKIGEYVNVRHRPAGIG